MCTKGVRPLVLIVDDDAHIARGLSNNLAFEGFAVRVANNHDGAMAIALHDSPDIVLLDVSKRPGCEMLRELREHHLDTRVIFLSTNPQHRDTDCASSADDFIAKPFALNDLLERVRVLAA